MQWRQPLTHTLHDRPLFAACHVVWLDHLSVPQNSHSALQETLLSRMMAVYATAGITVALRSIEPEGCRCGPRSMPRDWLQAIVAIIYACNAHTPFHKQFIGKQAPYLLYYICN